MAAPEDRDALVERLAVHARKLPPSERLAYLDRECARDERLRADVESLVAQLDRQAADLTRLLNEAGAGEQEAKDELWRRIYDELKEMARRELIHERRPERMSPTDLVNTAYDRLFPTAPSRWPNRRYFFVAAARAMQRILIERARPRKKDPPSERRVPLDDVSIRDLDRTDAIAVRDAIQKMEKLFPREAEVVYLRMYVGLSVPQVAKVLGVSERTIKSRWRFALTWLHRELSGGSEVPPIAEDPDG